MSEDARNRARQLARDGDLDGARAGSRSTGACCNAIANVSGMMNLKAMASRKGGHCLTVRISPNTSSQGALAAMGLSQSGSPRFAAHGCGSTSVSSGGQRNVIFNGDENDSARAMVPPPAGSRFRATRAAVRLNSRRAVAIHSH